MQQILVVLFLFALARSRSRSAPTTKSFGFFSSSCQQLQYHFSPSAVALLRFLLSVSLFSDCSPPLVIREAKGYVPDARRWESALLVHSLAAASIRNKRAQNGTYFEPVKLWILLFRLSFSITINTRVKPLQCLDVVALFPPYRRAKKEIAERERYRFRRTTPATHQICRGKKVHRRVLESEIEFETFGNAKNGIKIKWILVKVFSLNEIHLKYRSRCMRDKDIPRIPRGIRREVHLVWRGIQ